MCSATTRRPASAWCRRSRASTCRRLSLGQSSAVAVGEQVVVGGAGGRHHSVAARIAARQEFAGYWEYVLDEAIFTAPAHPNWGGTAVIGPSGELLGIGSLQLEQPREQGTEHLNMIVPIDLLKPILDDLLTLGRRNRPPRPWLGLYATEVNNRMRRGRHCRVEGRRARPTCAPATSCCRSAAPRCSDLAGLFRRIWSLGNAGVEVPMTIYRDGRTMDIAGSFRRPAQVPERPAPALKELRCSINKGRTTWLWPMSRTRRGGSIPAT